MPQIISDETARGPYWTIVRAGPFVFLSGQGSVDPATGQVVAGDIETETRLTLNNIAALLAEAGLGVENLVQVTCYLTDLAEWDRMNPVYAAVLGPGARPARTAVGVAALPFGLRIEMTAVAYAD